MKSRVIYWIPKILASSFGIFLIVFGEIDDSPGAQGLGLFLIIVSTIFTIKDRNK